MAEQATAPQAQETDTNQASHTMQQLEKIYPDARGILCFVETENTIILDSRYCPCCMPKVIAEAMLKDQHFAEMIFASFGHYAANGGLVVMGDILSGLFSSLSGGNSEEAPAPEGQSETAAS